MTSNDYFMVMTRVGVAELKSRLSEHLRLVRRGREITIFDRETPVALLVPVAAEGGRLAVRRPDPEAPRLVGLLPTEAPGSGTDVVALLLHERASMA